MTTIRYNEDKTVLDVPPIFSRSAPRSGLRTQAPLVPVFTITYGFLVNSNLVKAQEEPTGWFDLLYPRWKG
jgi:ABC-type Fe3+ transport system substrate-binding protein